MAEQLDRFWRQHPALLVGLTLLLATAAAFVWHPVLLLPMALLGMPLFLPEAYRRHHILVSRLWLMVPLFFGMVAYCHLHYLFPPEGVYEGTGVVAITTVSQGKSPFGETWQYKGTLRSFENDGEELIAHNIPIQITVPGGAGSTRQTVMCDYQLSGKLKATPMGYALNIPKSTVWIPIEGTWSAAEWRCVAKQAVIGYIHRHIRDDRAATFLAGLATGDFSDRQIRYSLGRFGLQHILAISGFHFAIVAASLCALLGILLPRKIAMGAVIVSLSGYFLFLGPGPSVMRAWMTILVALAGQLIDRRCRGLNALGVALVIMLVLDPYASQQVGFQLSFLAAGAILGFFSMTDLFLQRIWQKRRLGQLVALPWWQQHGFVLISVLRQATALNLAVHLVMVPICLFYFHKFPWLSLVFNLFFPFLVSLSMMLMIATLLVHPLLPPLANALHAFNNGYTTRILDLTFNMPTAFDYILRVPEFSAAWVIIFLSTLGCFSVWVHGYLERQRETNESLSYV